jgi:hypothetical protein
MAVDPMTGAAIAAAISALGNMLFGGGSSRASSAAAAPMPPEMRALINKQMQRMTMADPLYSDVLGMARGMLPTRYRGSMPRPPAPMTDNPGPGILGNKPGGNRTGPGGGAGQPDHTDPYNGWQPPRI